MFVGSVQAWVRGFRHLGSWVRRQVRGFWVLLLGFAAWVRQFVGSLLSSSTGFVVSVFSVLISCFKCFADCGCRGFFFFPDAMDFF